MEIQKAFDIMISKTAQLLTSRGYVREEVAPSEAELTALFVGENAYSIVYTYSNKRIVLRSCDTEDGEPDNKWKTLATWLYDTETDGNREAESIGDDFAETIQGPKQTAAAASQKQKKRKKEGEATVDSMFLANRMVTYFPELKDEIAYEKSHYSEFRGITFAEEKILPLFVEMVNAANQKKLEKLSAGLASMYSSGDLDTKGIITYILLNSVESDEKFMQLISAFSEADQKVTKAARKLRGKKIKPEKPSKKRNYISDTLKSI